MTPRLLTTPEAAERLGLTPGSLLELRWRDDGLPIFQQGLNVHYRLEDLEAFEQRELRKLLTQALQHDRPLPLIRSIARSLNLAVILVASPEWRCHFNDYAPPVPPAGWHCAKCCS